MISMTQVIASSPSTTDEDFTLPARLERSGCKSCFASVHDAVPITRLIFITSSVGTAVEHHTLYQYQLANTKNIFMGQIQTETP